MPAFDGMTKRFRGRPSPKGWGNGQVLIKLDDDIAAALEAYDPNPENKSRTIRALIEIALQHVTGAAQ